MPAKVRKQIYLDQRQNRLLKRLAEARGVSEAEVVRELIDWEAVAGAARPQPPSQAAWEAILKFSQQRAQAGKAGEPYQWNRDEIYEERLRHFGPEASANSPRSLKGQPTPSSKTARKKPARPRLTAR